MSSRRTTTLLLRNIPDKCLLGIDLQFFTASADFNGIRAIPDGVHVLHWSPPAPATASVSALRDGDDDEDDNEDEEMSTRQRERDQEEDQIMANVNLRMAVFFEAGYDTSVIVLRWDDAVEQFVRTTDLNSLREVAQLQFLPYPETTPPFESLTSALTIPLLDAILPNSYTHRNVPVSSITASSSDILLIEETLAKTAPERHYLPSPNDVDDSFRFLMFDLTKQRTWREGATGREVTMAALDRSWFLNDLLSRQRGNNYSAIVAEFQLSFLLVVLLANYSAAEQWRRILELLCTCTDAIGAHPRTYIALLNTLLAQLECVPEVYFTDLLEGGSNAGREGFLAKNLKNLRKSILNPARHLFALQDSSSPPLQVQPPINASIKAEMLQQMTEIADLLDSKFGIIVSTDSRTSDRSAAAAARHRQHNQNSALGVMVESIPQASTDVHHYGSDNDDDDLATRARRAFYNGVDSDDAEEERGEYAPVFVEL
ncbi:AAR2 protein-domain-containing protein [Limtongia smithiae]|uniref:AAR2 protein-domain-containing protein n=1 Tax=Limtongia smithiae TaxID=1125753 RepID=UPI0034CF7ABE